VLAIVCLWLLPTVAHTIGSLVTQPVLLVEHWIRTSESALPVYVRDRAALEAEIRTLTEQLALQASLILERDAVVAENAQLRKLVSGDVATRATSTIVAHVLATPPYVPYDRLVINRGSHDGVREGALVYAGERMVLGSVIKTTPWQSVVELLSSPGRESTIYIFGPDIYTTAVGQGGGVMQVGVPQGVPIAVGNPVVLPAGSQTIIGAIERIDTTPSRPEQFAYLTLPISLPSIQTVMVASEPQPPISFEIARERVAEMRAKQFMVPVPEEVLVDVQVGSRSATGTATSSIAE